MRDIKYLSLICAVMISSCSHVSEEEGPGNTTCLQTCLLGEKKCTDDNMSMQCRKGSDGCPIWFLSECANHKVCYRGACVSEDELDDMTECTDECTQQDLRECIQVNDLSGYKQCANSDDDLCLEWSEFVSCPFGTVCEDGVCGDCESTCPSSGQRECIDGGLRTCIDLDGDGCFEWSEVTPCANGCENNRCKCATVCDLDSTRCDGDGYQVCMSGEDGCTKWSATLPCDNGCQGNACMKLPGECEGDSCTEPPPACEGDSCTEPPPACEGESCEPPKEECEIIECIETLPAECKGTECGNISSDAITLYPGDRILSPMTRSVIESMRNIANVSGQDDKHFSKLGDGNMTTTSSFMSCFSKSNTQSPYLNGAKYLQSVIDEFQTVDDSFLRNSKATMDYGMANDGTISFELDDYHPRFAFYGFGIKDMDAENIIGMNNDNTPKANYYKLLETYYQNADQDIQNMIKKGTIPLLIGTGMRSDNPYNYLANLKPGYYVSIFDAVLRGLAQKYQLPYMNLQLAQKGLNNNGLMDDGIHRSVLNGGCDFSENGMKYGMNVTNRYAIEMLARSWETVVNKKNATIGPIELIGSGSHTDPYIISGLPFTHTASTRNGSKVFDKYNCSTTGESGPERIYKMTLDKMTKIRAFAVSAKESKTVDIDIHLLDELNQNHCIARGHRYLEYNLSPGTYYFALDSFGVKDDNRPGEYLFAVLTCEALDISCLDKDGDRWIN